MSMIRDKKLKKYHSDSRNTIDQIHNDIIHQKKIQFENLKINEKMKLIKKKKQNYKKKLKIQIKKYMNIISKIVIY